MRHHKNYHPGYGNPSKFLRKNPSTPSDFATVQDAINDAVSGQIVHIDAGVPMLQTNINIASDLTLKIHTGTTLNLNGYTITKGSGEIVLESGAVVNPRYCVKTGSTINGFYPTLNSALSNASSGQTVEVKTSTALTNNILVPSGVTLKILSGTKLTMNSYNVTRASGASIILLSTRNNIPDVRLQSGPTVLGLYSLISSGLSASASGQYVHVRGPNTVANDLTVSSDKNLKIYPGATIIFPDYKEMRVYGTLDAQGTSSNKIIFTSADGTPNNYENSYLIRFYSGSNGSLENCILKNAQRGVYLDHSSIHIEDSEIKRCGYGIYNYYSNSFCYNNNINNNSYGIYNYYSSPEIDYTEISNSSYMGIWCDSYSSPNLDTPGHNYLHSDNYVLFGVYANNNSNPELGIGSCSINSGRNTIDYDNYDLAVVHAGSNCNIRAENNYWGTSTPSPNMFSGNVDWYPYLTSQPSFNIQGNSPEVSEFDIAFSMNSAGNDGIESDVLLLYDENWKLKNKTKFIQIMINNDQAQNVHKLCKDIIRDYPDSSEAFFALDLLYQASRIKTMKSGKDIKAFKNYLVELSQKKDLKEIYGSAELLLAGLEREKGITRIDDVFKKYRNTYLAETALFQKFMHYYNENGDDKISRNALAELENHFPNSEYTLEAYHNLGEKTDIVYKYDITNMKKELSGKETNKEDLKAVPKEYKLSGIFPNPFNPSTVIKYELPFESQINISIFNIMGKKVKNIEFSNQSAGNHQIVWDGTNNNSVRVPSGVYIVKFKAISNVDDNNDIFMKTMKMTILK
ncbi:MAG: FlgD immunoglobulin-like domain containing protein [Candidatus Marinimicrobia bacterium]|nr:FlgD immunoglobulin-like domain containing protein [Candidatus Neomarinimicrobiota bacterium]